jgi:hypothetical protein
MSLQVSFRVPAKPGHQFSLVEADAMVGEQSAFDADPRFLPEGVDPHVTGKVVAAKVIDGGRAVRVTIERDVPDPSAGDVDG